MSGQPAKPEGVIKQVREVALWVTFLAGTVLVIDVVMAAASLSTFLSVNHW